MLPDSQKRTPWLIDLSSADRTESGLRIAILDYDPPSKNEGWVIDLLHQMAQVGHSAFFANKTLVELGMNVQRVSRLVRETEADACPSPIHSANHLSENR